MPTKQESHSQRQKASNRKRSGKAYDQTQRKANPALRIAKEIRSSGRWQRLRLIKLGRNPVCEDPLFLHQDIPIAASQVDHIVPLGKDLSLAFVLANLQSLCTHCHGVKSAGERTA